jgi:hypothetical protein
MLGYTWCCGHRTATAYYSQQIRPRHFIGPEGEKVMLHYGEVK